MNLDLMPRLENHESCRECNHTVFTHERRDIQGAVVDVLECQRCGYDYLPPENHITQQPKEGQMRYNG